MVEKLLSAPAEKTGIVSTSLVQVTRSGKAQLMSFSAFSTACGEAGVGSRCWNMFFATATWDFSLSASIPK